MTDSSGSAEPLVWLPFDPSELGEVPTGLRYETVDPTAGDLPDSVAEVAFYVPPYQLGTAVAEPIAHMERLQVVQMLSAGVDNVRSAVPEGVTLCNGRGIHDTSTAELTLALVLASLRGIPGFVRAAEERRYEVVWRPALADKRVLLVGYGSIGQAIEARLRPFEVDVVRVARTARDLDDGPVHAISDLPDLLGEADVVVLIVPLTDETRGLIDAEAIGRMKPGALLVNMARGAVVVTDDLVAALHEERITAALDVYDVEPLPADHPLWTAPGVLLSPHVGGASSAMWPRAHRLVREQLERFAAGRPLHNQMTGAY